MSSRISSPAPERTLAVRYGRDLLRSLGRCEVVSGSGDVPALAWRRAGLMNVTGPPDKTGLVCPAPLASIADGTLLALKALAPAPGALPVNGGLLLGERARLMGLRRGGRTSANGSCHLLETRDGRIALNLARSDDWDLLAAWLEQDARDLDALRTCVSRNDAMALVERGAMLGLALARDDAPGTTQWCDVRRVSAGACRTERAPLVVDLSSLWAGPLAGSLLAMMGARVVKVESVSRPDGARRGHGGFYDVLNADKASVALDFGTNDGRQALIDLVRQADIVIEGSRPRALRQLGIDAEAMATSGTTWVSITGHGRTGENADRIGYGDDASVAAGLATVMAHGWGTPVFAGDAIADPLTGLHAALAAWAGWLGGGGQLVALSLREVIGHALGAGVADKVTLRSWQRQALADDVPLYPLRTARPARPFGADTREILLSC